MNRQKDLINVFNFLAEYLREEQTNIVEEVVNESTTIEVEPQQKPEREIFGVPSSNILELMKKIESIDKQKAEVNALINQHDRSFAKELKRIREEHEELIKKFESTDNETTVLQTGTTITQDIISSGTTFSHI